MARELQFERRLERRCCFDERLAPNVAVGAHHRRRDVSHLRLDNPVWLPLLGQPRERGVASIVETYMSKPRSFS